MPGNVTQNGCNDSLDNGSGDETSSVGSTSTVNDTRSETPVLAATRGRRGRKMKKKKPACSSANADFKYSCWMKEDHGSELFGVQFNKYTNKGQIIFATVGKNRATVYECLPSGGLDVLMVFVDVSPTEVFYTCAWSYPEPFSLLAVAGSCGVVRVINVETGFCFRSFTGHGAAVNEVKFHPKDFNLLLSASKDHTLRLWNVKSNVCVAILGNVEGHRDEVLSCDFDSNGDKILSCGMDHAVKLWRLDKEEVKDAIRASHLYHPRLTGGEFPTHLMHFPDFSTRDVHKNYADCVRWAGGIVFSKSCDNQIVCWKPGRLQDQTLRPNETKWTLIHTFDYVLCDIWFMRFCLDLDNMILALGNKYGKIYVWNLNPSDPANSTFYELAHPKCTTSIRQIAVSADGSVLVAACDDSTVWRWDRISNQPPKAGPSSGLVQVVSEVDR